MMMDTKPYNISISYPISPLHVNQPFGANYAYYWDKFKTNGHMGIDFMALDGEPIFAAHDGTVNYYSDDHGGFGCRVITPGWQTVYWHLVTDVRLFPNDTQVKKGTIIGYADNSGAPFESSGTHLHFGLIPDGEPTTNGWFGCVDPEPYFDGQFAGNSQLTNLWFILALAKKYGLLTIDLIKKFFGK